MPVYIIRAGQHGPVKIGFSEDVVGRLVKMQAELHERFANNWLHGEWFSFTKVMLGDLGLQEVKTNPDEVTRALRELAAASRVAAVRRPPSPEPTAAEKACLTERLRALVAMSEEAREPEPV